MRQPVYEALVAKYSALFLQAMIAKPQSATVHNAEGELNESHTVSSDLKTKAEAPMVHGISMVGNMQCQVLNFSPPLF